MAIMKQIDECLTRFVQKKMPLRKKWKAYLNCARFNPTLLLFHYDHLILEFDLTEEKVLNQWWEKTADKRGLNSAIEWLNQNNDKVKDFVSSLGR